MKPTLDRSIDLYDFVAILYNRKFLLISIFIISLVTSNIIVPKIINDRHITSLKITFKKNRDINPLTEYKIIIKQDEFNEDIINIDIENLEYNFLTNFKKTEILNQLSEGLEYNTDYLYDNLNFDEIDKKVTFTHNDKLKKSEIIINHIKNVERLAIKELIDKNIRINKIHLEELDQAIEFNSNLIKEVISKKLYSDRQEFNKFKEWSESLPNDEESVMFDRGFFYNTSPFNLNEFKNVFNGIDLLNLDIKKINDDIDKLYNLNAYEIIQNYHTFNFELTDTHSKLIEKLVKDIDERRILNDKISFIDSNSDWQQFKFINYDKRDIKLRTISSRIKPLILLFPILITFFSILVFIFKDNKKINFE